ncbi:MAG TPA: hydroxyacid dehydrogenase [Aliidongia sp.]|uniref:hydroxyacid dehydrogenase n=1 Tax=Aliidongia sp. TaxID=1914230 RepID=UPI002DDDB122|nr:hydroxyacid dehydrogenase [Aliidongia sp.]HEV2678335.1 hydroxyacid dehydrogenase [Aliidongia sp.]
MTDVLITEFLDEESVAALQADYAVHYDPGLCERPDEIAALAPGVPALIVRNRTQVRGAVLAAFDRLKVIGRLGVGLDNIDVAVAEAMGIEVCPAVGANAASVAEYVVAACLITLRNIWQSADAVLAGQWPRNQLMFNEVQGKRLGLIGFGSIGREVARRALALGMEVVATDRPGTDPASFAGTGVTLVDGTTLLATSDVVSIHAPSMPETYRLIDAGALAAMKPGAVLINSARGGMVDEAALVAALTSGRLAAAVLDVFEDEPLKAGSNLVGVPNLWLTPHVSGVTVESNARVSTVTLANVRRVLKAL